jgi:hypothetical protein
MDANEHCGQARGLSHWLSSVYPRVCRAARAIANCSSCDILNHHNVVSHAITSVATRFIMAYDQATDAI